MTERMASRNVRRYARIGGAAALTTTALTTGTGLAAPPRAEVFTLGVASGDPTPDGVVLWTRLARDPRAARGGMTETAVDVDWQVADDERFTRIRASGRTRTGPEDGYAVHVEVRGLPAGGTFSYRGVVRRLAGRFTSGGLSQTSGFTGCSNQTYNVTGDLALSTPSGGSATSTASAARRRSPAT